MVTVFYYSTIVLVFPCSHEVTIYSLIESFAQVFVNSASIWTIHISSDKLTFQVGSEFDVKENIFRNYAQLLGPYSDLSVRHMWGPGPEFKVSIAFIDPANIVAASHDVVIPKTGHIGSHMPKMNTPLRPGSWHCKLMIDYKVVVEVKFLVVPLTSFQLQPLNLTQARLSHNGPERGHYLNDSFSEFKDVLHVDKTDTAQKEADLNGLKTGTDLEQWVDMLTQEFWDIHKTCIVEGSTGYCDMLESCRKVTWSSLSPDPKSEIFGVDKKSGRLLWL